MDSHGKYIQSNNATSKGTENGSNGHRDGRRNQKNQGKTHSSNKKQGRSTQGVPRKRRKQDKATNLSDERTQLTREEPVNVSGVQSSPPVVGNTKAKKEKAPRTFKEIMDDVGRQEAKSGSLIDRYVDLVMELPLVKDLNGEQIPHFFASINEQIEEAWAPFLSKIAIKVNPNKAGVERMIADEIQKCCENVMEDCGLPLEMLQRTLRDFCESKNEEVITEYLHTCSCVEPTVPVQEGLSPTRKITDQELACVSYAYLTLGVCSAFPSDYQLLVKLDRAIAEYFGKNSLREQAGKTVGNILSSRQYSPKRISDLTYLYSETSEHLRQKSARIEELEDTVEQLRGRNTELIGELSKWKGSHADSVRQIEELEEECAQLKKDREAADNMLEFEKNRFQRQMQSKDAGLAKQLSKKIELEIQAIRETAEYVDEDNQRRLYRRLGRIDDILRNFGGSADV